MRLQFEQLARTAQRELARGLRASRSVRLFGFELDAVEPGRAVVGMKVRAQHKQVHGVVHGGILAGLADTAAGLAIYSALPRGTRLATIEMKINYLEPVHQGRLLAEARLLRKGRNLAVAACDVRDTHSRLVATALLTFSIGPVQARRTR